jgi:hypothetical protein
MSQNETSDIINILHAQDTRIDYNFNTLIQTSIIVEYLLHKLNQINPDANWEEDFPPFQAERLEELEKLAKSAREEMKDEEESQELSSNLDSIKL